MCRSILASILVLIMAVTANAQPVDILREDSTTGRGTIVHVEDICGGEEQYNLVYIVTCAHVIGLKHRSAMKYNGKYWPLQPVIVDGNADVAIVVVVMDKNVEIKPIALAENGPKIGDKLKFLLRDDEILETSAAIASTPYTTTIIGPVQKGDSGSPGLDCEGKLACVVTEAYKEFERIDGPHFLIADCVSASRISFFLKKAIEFPKKM